MIESEFPKRCVMAPVDAKLISVNDSIATEKDLEGLSLFLTPSDMIDGVREVLSEAILKDRHHRSSELPHGMIRVDKHGGLYSVRRLKGNGLYSGPKSGWRHRVRNIKKDATGLVLGLQSREEYEKSLNNSVVLREMGIETEIPEGAFEIGDVIYRTRDGVVRLSVREAFDKAGLPEEYKDIPFVIRVDSLGINHRMIDYIHADDLIRGWKGKGNVIRKIMLDEASKFLVAEMAYRGSEIPAFDFENNICGYLEFIVKRIVRNVALLHLNGGVHKQFTAQNLTLDGKFIDYDTLDWLTGAELDEAKMVDLKKLFDSLRLFLNEVASPVDIERILTSAKLEYTTSIV